MLFDYEIPHKCQYPVFNEIDCGEPAPYHIWWKDDKDNGIWVCKKHFDIIKKIEDNF